MDAITVVLIGWTTAIIAAQLAWRRKALHLMIVWQAGLAAVLAAVGVMAIVAP